MKNNLIRLLAFILLIVLLGPAADAQFQCLETDNLRLIHIGGIHSFIAPYVAQCYENSLSFHNYLFDFTPSQKITIYLYDFTDYGNAGASAIPQNRISIGLAPVSYAFETAPANERINAIMNHELVHVLAMDKAAGSDKFFRGLFHGKVESTSDNPMTIVYNYLTSPRRSAPLWYHEGIAVFMETWMTGGLGRALGAYDEMVFRTLVRDSARIYSRVGLESEGTRIDFQVGVNSYLYGTRFMSYLARQYDPECLVEWVSRSGGSKKYFSSQFEKVYNAPLDEIWGQWIEWERRFQEKNLDTIRQYPVTYCRNISSDPLGSVSNACYDSTDNRLYVGVNFPGQVAHIAGIGVDDGKIKKISDVKGAGMFFVCSMTFDPKTRTLFYTTDNNDWRDLKAIDLNTGKSRMLQKDLRVGDLAFNDADSSIWGVRHFNGISTLVRIAYPYDDWDQIYSWPYGKDVYDIDISPDGTLLTGSLAEISGRQTLISMDIEKLMNGDTTYQVLHDFMHSIPEDFAFSPDGKYLYGSSYYTGVSNVFRYDLEADSMEAVSNCETGLFRPVPYSDDSLIAFRYTAKGFIPVIMPDTIIEDINPVRYLGQEVVEEHPLVREWMAGSPASVDIDSITTYSGAYNAFSGIRLLSVYPVVEGYRHYTSTGLRFNLSDPLGMHTSSLTASYTPSQGIAGDERWHVNWRYDHLDWHLNFRYNGADFYDLFGPTRTSRKGYSLGLRYKKTLLYDKPKTMDYTISITGYGGLERLPDYQNVRTSYDKFLSTNFRLSFMNQRASLGAVDYEKGVMWQFAISSNYVSEKLYPHFRTGLDLGIPLPLNHSSFWLRNSIGYSPGDRFEPFANFFFGGFGNNWVDYRSEKRYRDFYSFPGVELNAIGGTNYGRVMAEWILPPLRFRKAGFPSFYCTWVRTAIFSSAITTNVDDRSLRRTLFNVGSQIDFRLILLSHHYITFSIGYAAAFEKDFDMSDEFMVSLKLL